MCLNLDLQIFILILTRKSTVFVLLFALFLFSFPSQRNHNNMWFVWVWIYSCCHANYWFSAKQRSLYWIIFKKNNSATHQSLLKTTYQRQFFLRWMNIAGFENWESNLIYTHRYRYRYILIMPCKHVKNAYPQNGRN